MTCQVVLGMTAEEGGFDALSDGGLGVRFLDFRGPGTIIEADRAGVGGPGTAGHTRRS